MKILITGAAGFIGASLSNVLLKRGDEVTGADNLNDYYDVRLKEARLNILREKPKFTFHKLEISNRPALATLFSAHSFDIVVHLAAQAGVRYSIENPYAYIDSNLVGFGNVLEGCRHHGISHLVYASSSSVYGANTKLPFSEGDGTDQPMSLYAATKKANELMAHAYSHLYRLPTTGLRFFTVYGPWGRPDMALFKFTRNILAGDPIPVYNDGRMVRDFTYIDDIVTGVVLVVDQLPLRVAQSDDSREKLFNEAPWKIYNIGTGIKTDIKSLLEELKKSMPFEISYEVNGSTSGDQHGIFANIELAKKEISWFPNVSLADGLNKMINYYLYE